MTTRAARRPNGLCRSASRRPTSSTTARPTARASAARGPTTSARSAAQVVSANGSSESYDPKATDFQALAQKIKSSGADVVFVGAITGQGTAKLWKDIKAGQPEHPDDRPGRRQREAWYDGAGAAGNGTYLTFGGVDISQLQGNGKTWADEYKTAHNGTQPPFYARTAKAAAQVTLAALQKAAHQRPPGSPQGRSWARADSTPSSARWPSTPNGDAKGGVISSYQVGTSWPPEFKGVITAGEVTASRPPTSPHPGRAQRPAPDAIWPIRAPSHHEGTSTAWTNSSRP